MRVQAPLFRLWLLKRLWLFELQRALVGAMSSLDEIQSLINSAKDELAESRRMKDQVEHETVQVPFLVFCGLG